MKVTTSKPKKISRYEFNHNNFDMDYFISVSNYHNSCVITSINGEVLTKTKYMNQLPDIINKYPTTEAFQVECDNAEQNFTLILESMSKKSLLNSVSLRLKEFQCPFYRLSEKPIYVFADQSGLYVYDDNVHKIDDIAFDVDDGFYTDNQDHPHALVIKELNNLYQTFRADNGLKAFRQDTPEFAFPTEKQLDEFYKKEFAGLTFRPITRTIEPHLEKEVKRICRE